MFERIGSLKVSRGHFSLWFYLAHNNFVIFPILLNLFTKTSADPTNTRDIASFQLHNILFSTLLHTTNRIEYGTRSYHLLLYNIIFSDDKVFQNSKVIQKYEAYSVLMFVPHHLHIKVQWCSRQWHIYPLSSWWLQVQFPEGAIIFQWIGLDWIESDYISSNRASGNYRWIQS